MAWTSGGRPTFASKLNTLVQLAYLLAILMYKAISFPPVILLEVGAVLTLITTAASGLGYVIEYTRRAAAAPA